MQDHDPFTFPLGEIRAHDAGRRRWPVGERDCRLDQLLIEEAQEVAWGRRHLTIVHGCLVGEGDAEALDDIVCVSLDLLEGRWYRFGGIPDHHVTLTVDGPDADLAIALVGDAAVAIRPRHWMLLQTAVVEVQP